MKFITQNKGQFIQQIIAVCLLAALWMGFTILTHEDPSLAQAQIAASSCTASSSKVAIGNQASTQIVATSSNRAFVRIQQLDNATNTVHFRFAQGGAATLANATAILEKVSATGTDKILEVGKSTPLPYTGAITAITDSGSSTVMVTDCLYN